MQTDHIKLGDLYATIYTLEVVGEAVEMHTHTFADNHITIVQEGSLRVVKGDGTFSEHLVGDIIDHEDNQAHELVALVANTIVYNIRKNVNNGLITTPELLFSEAFYPQ